MADNEWSESGEQRNESESGRGEYGRSCSIRISGIDYAYEKGKLILDDVSLDIENPQLVSIIGPNGVGKSTLIHCMNRILSPSKGTVLIDGRDISRIRVKDLAKKIGYVPCSADDCFPLTVVDTVLMGRNPHSRWKGDLRSDMKVVEEALELMDIKPLAMRQFNELSAGQHQRVMLARGLAQEPEILLLDEPTSNLDLKHQMDVIRILKSLSSKKGIAIVMISHDVNLAARYSDNIIMMLDGGIYDAGRPSDVITRESIKAVYGVDSEILYRNGRPVVLPIDEGSEDATPVTKDCFVSSSSIARRTG